MKLTSLFQSFFQNEKAGGIVLIFCTIISLLLANSSISEAYTHFWHSPIIGQNNLEYWINDGLMAIFFLLVGLELKRELLVGELSNLKKALLPVVGALGGMLVPAFIYIIFNIGTNTQSGAGIPMATDIAFAVGVLSLLGKRVPLAIKVFLTALAVIDDLGAIIVIALFYSGSPNWVNLGASLGIFLILMLGNKSGIKTIWFYLIGGCAMWYFMLHSGVHATITGVLLAISIPFDGGSKNSLSHRMQSALHLPVPFIILPLFALANTAIPLHGIIFEVLKMPYSLGISAGLIIGKPLGITLFSYISVKAGWCRLAGNVNWKEMLGVGFLGGIGFTMSIFVTLLAFTDVEIINHAKIVIMLSSLTAALLGYFILLGVVDNKK